MKYIVLFPVVFALFMSIACQREYYNTNIGRDGILKNHPANGLVYIPARKAPNHLEDLMPASQYFVKSAEHDIHITAAQGTTVFISAGCLRDEKGFPVMGKVEVELKEVYSKKDMILSNKPSVSNKQILESNGEIFVDVRQNGRPVFIGCEEGIEIGLSSGYTYDMKFFYAEENAAGNINWVQDDVVFTDLMNTPTNETEGWEGEGDWQGPPDTLAMWFNSSEEYNSVNKYLFSTKQLGWINCDRFYDNPREKTDMIVQLKNFIPEGSTTNVFLVFSNINSVMQLYSEDGTNYTISNIPVGEVVEIVALSGNGERMLFAKNSWEIMKDDKMTMELTACGKEEIKKQLEGI